MEKVSSLNCAQSTGWFANVYKKLVTKAFSSIETGQIVLDDNNERTVLVTHCPNLKLLSQ